MKKLAKKAVARLRAIDLSDPTPVGEEELVRQNQSYWQDSSRKKFDSNSHWRGTGPFRDDGLWNALGQNHLELFRKAAVWANVPQPLRGVVDWGSGGGMNAVHFFPEAERYYGVDISDASLEECARQIARLGEKKMTPVLIDAADPEAASDAIEGPVDLFLCTYVFELIPSPEYGLRIMQIAYDVLESGGIALVQIRYHQGRKDQLSKRRNYAKNFVSMTTYAIDEFWSAASDIGFKPIFAHLLPQQPELNESNYAYFALVK